MNRSLLFALALLSAVSASRAGAAPLRFTVTLDTLWNAGDTRYLMEEPGLGFSSELIFPLDTLLEGLRLRYEPGGRKGHPWVVEASFFTNVMNPLGLMQDFDWYYVYSGIPKVPVTYTESAAAMRWYLAAVEAQLGLCSGGWGRLGFTFGYRFQFIKQTIIGFKGWDMDPDRDGVFTPPERLNNTTAHALDYQIIYNIVTTGLVLTLTPAPAVAVTAEAGPALPYVSDRDDHVIRSMLSTASGFGYGGYAGLEARYTWAPANPRLRPFVALSGSALWLKANTSQIQYHYDTGTRSTPADHQISTRQYRLAFIFGLQF